MPDLINKIPDIIEKSGNLFGIFALISIIFAVIVILFFGKGTSKEKFQALGLVFLFFLGVGASALIAGLSAGTERGSEIAVEQIQQDPAIVRLSPAMIQQLETYLTAQNQTIDEKNKVKLLEIALNGYLNPPVSPTPSTSSIPSALPTDLAQGSSTSSSSSQVGVDSFVFDLQGCQRKNSTVLCSFLVTNEEGDKRLTIYGKSSYRSRAVDPNGNQYISNNVDFGGDQRSNYVENTLPENIAVKVELTFADVPETVSQFSILEALAYTREQNRFPVQFRDVQVTN
ncbi:MAG: hypothetical protein AAFV72_02005 [Cyanobacteria bacterium J06635_1]